jgi:hypothetical protein
MNDKHAHQDHGRLNQQDSSPITGPGPMMAGFMSVPEITTMECEDEEDMD